MSKKYYSERETKIGTAIGYLEASIEDLQRTRNQRVMDDNWMRELERAIERIEMLRQEALIAYETEQRVNRPHEFDNEVSA